MSQDNSTNTVTATTEAQDTKPHPNNEYSHETLIRFSNWGRPDPRIIEQRKNNVVRGLEGVAKY